MESKNKPKLVITVGPDEKWVRCHIDGKLVEDLILYYDKPFLGTELSEGVVCDIESELYERGITFPNGFNYQFREFGDTGPRVKWKE